MIVNDKRLKHLLKLALQDHCFRCPLRTDKENCKHNVAKSYDEMIEPCESYILNWLQGFDVEDIPSEPEYGTPCESVPARGKPSILCEYCDYMYNCPYH